VLNDVSCTSSSACTAVGSSGIVPLAERWDGRKWSIQPTFGPARGAFENVSCASKRDCVAVGYAGNNPLAERWNGVRWSREAIPSNGYFGGKYGIPNAAGGAFTGLWCGSTSACVAVGGWSSICYSLRPRYPGDCTEGRLMWRWNESRWSFRANTPRGVASGRLSCVSALWCVAVGTGANFHADVQHWNGVRWAPQPVPSANGVLSDVSCASATVCIAVGDAFGNEPRALAWSWNGQGWTDRSPPNPSSAAVIR
jgi:hypothetical protein